MTEDNKNEETGKVETPEGTGDGDKSELAKQTETANAAAERMEKAEKRLVGIKEELEAIRAKNRLGGSSEAGKPAEEAKKETPREYAERMERGGK